MKINDVPHPRARLKPLPKGSGGGGKRPGCLWCLLTVVPVVLARLLLAVPPAALRTSPVPARGPSSRPRRAPARALVGRADNGRGRAAT